MKIWFGQIKELSLLIVKMYTNSWKESINIFRTDNVIELKSLRISQKLNKIHWSQQQSRQFNNKIWHFLNFRQTFVCFLLTVKQTKNVHFIGFSATVRAVFFSFLKMSKFWVALLGALTIIIFFILWFVVLSLRTLTIRFRQLRLVGSLQKFQFHKRDVES